MILSTKQNLNMVDKEFTGVIILNYNTYIDTLNCIKSIENFNTSPIKIIVVDNASTNQDNCLELDSQFKVNYANRYQKFTPYDIVDVLPYLSFIENKENGGYAKGNNIGLKFAEMDHSIKNVLILNNDILFVEDVIPRLLDVLYTIGDAAIVSPVLFKKGLKELDKNCARENVSVWHLVKFNFLHYCIKGLSPNGNYYLDKDIKGDFLPIELPSGSCMMLKKDYFKSIGWFDPNTFLYYEENILGKKIQKCKKNNYLVLDCKCIHLGASSTAKEPSHFIYKVGQNSRRYYVDNYSGAGRLTRYIYYLSEYFDMCIYSMLHTIKKIIK